MLCSRGVLCRGRGQEVSRLCSASCIAALRASSAAGHGWVPTNACMYSPVRGLGGAAGRHGHQGHCRALGLPP